MKILVLGGGVVGVTTAYQLLKDGHQVTVIDREPPAIGGASYGNAGLIAVGHCQAWASPEALKLWLNSFLRPHPVFRMKLRLDPHLIRWGLQFLSQCTHAAAKRNSLAKHRISTYSQQKLQEVVAETGIEYERNQNGLLYLYRNPEVMAEGVRHTGLFQDAGQTLEAVGKEQALKIIPELADARDTVAGGVFSPGDESGDSRIFTEQLTRVCRKMGGIFEAGVSIERLEASGDQIQRIVSNRGVYSADRYVLSLGAWSPLLVRPLGIRISIYPVKGYSVTIPVEEGHTPPQIGGLHEEDLLGFAPMGDHFRVSSISEFGGYDRGHTPEDFEHLLRAAKKLFPNAGNYDKAEYWCGFRPMTPEGTPLLGTGRHSNLYYNTGHGHLGWTMSCGSARITADLIAGKTPEIPCQEMKTR